MTENQYKNVLTAIDLVSSSLASRAGIPVSDDLDPVLDEFFDDESVPDSVVEGLVGLCVFLLDRLEHETHRRAQAELESLAHQLRRDRPEP